MVGLMQVMIYLMCVYLGYKGIEIFQIALVAPASTSRKVGIALGVLMIAGAVGVSAVAIFLAESTVARMAR